MWRLTTVYTLCLVCVAPKGLITYTYIYIFLASAVISVFLAALVLRRSRDEISLHINNVLSFSVSGNVYYLNSVTPWWVTKHISCSFVAPLALRNAFQKTLIHKRFSYYSATYSQSYVPKRNEEEYSMFVLKNVYFASCRSKQRYPP